MCSSMCVGQILVLVEVRGCTIMPGMPVATDTLTGWANYCGVQLQSRWAFLVKTWQQQASSFLFWHVECF